MTIATSIASHRLNRRSLLGRSAAIGAGLAVTGSIAANNQAFAQTPTTTGSTLVAAAEVFLATLDAAQQEAVLFDWDDTGQKQRWSNFPTGLFDRDGIMWADLADDSREAWLALMQAAMSPAGYARVMVEWEADQILADEQSGSDTGAGTPPDGQTDEAPEAPSGEGGPANGGPGGGGQGGGQLLGTDYYWVALIGTQSATEPWQIQFGGHHIAVNVTVQGDQIAYTPAFVGVQWGTYTDATGDTVRPLGEMEDDAFALINLLDAAQQQTAIIGDEYIQLTVGPGEEGDGVALESAGIAGAEMTAEQQTVFLRLIGHYVTMGLESVATKRMATIEDDLGETTFAWSGPTTQGEPAYFRIVGPTVNIEYSPQQMGNDPANHIHAIYRDPTDLYGSSFTGVAVA